MTTSKKPALPDMAGASTTPRPAVPPPLTPGAAFLVQLRGGSQPAEERLSGRIEHLRTGDSEPFASLSELLLYMARYTDGGPHP